MKKIITILMAACLMVSLLGISALAAPATHTLPVLVDFDNENLGQNNYRYYTTNPVNWFYLSGYGYIVENPSDATDRYLNLQSNQNVRGGAGVKFNDFLYDSTAPDGVQAEKLVVSLETEITTIDTVESTFGVASHVTVGVSDDSKFVNNDRAAYDAGITPTYSPFTTDAMYLDYAVVDGQIANISTISGRSYAATDFDNHAFLTAANNGGKLYYTIVLDLTRDADGYGNFDLYINGSKGNNKKFYAANIDKINAVGIATGKKNFANFDNIRVYTVPNEKIAVTSQSVASTDVPYTTESVTVNFSHEIIDAADRYISVKKGNTLLTEGVDYTMEHVTSETGAKTDKAIKVNFAEELAYGTTYSVVASADYFGMDGIALGEETTLASFTTEAAPQINLSAFTLKKGVFGNTVITDLSDALGSTVCVTTTATNADIRGAATGTVFFGVYKNDVLVSLAYVNKNFAADETDDISVNVKLPAASASDTVAIKAFVCEGITNINPYGTTIQVSTAD